MSAIALALLILAAPAQPLSFGASVESVYVDVSVSRRGEPVLGLTARDFELKDNGERQTIQLATTDPMPPTTLLVLDVSGSVAGETLDRLRQGAESVTRALHPGDGLGLITFNETVALRAAPSSDRSAFRGALLSIQAGGATSLYDALYAGAVLGSQRGHSLLVLFTDGEDNASWLSIRDVERALGTSNILVQVVGVTPAETIVAAGNLRLGPWSTRPQGSGSRSPAARRVAELTSLAEATGGRFWQAGSTRELSSAFESMLAALRTRYVLRFDPASQRRPGLHKLTVKLRGRRGEVHCRKSYFVPPEAMPGDD